MVPGPRRIGPTGSAPFIRLLARLADVDAPESKQAFAERLSQWLGWTDAISLSAALNGGPAAARVGARASVGAEEAEFNRLRAALARAIAEDDAFVAGNGRPGPRVATGGVPPLTSTPMTTTAEFSAYRRRYAARQQAMEAGIGPLRSRLRAKLAARSPAMAQLAAVDAVMEQVLGEREQHLLSTVPSLLERRFVRLRQANELAQADKAVPGDEPAPPETSEAQPAVWLDMFCKDMQAVLFAELDIRLQPVEGLLEALRKS